MENENRSRWQKVLDSTISGVVLALVLGFFAVLWRASYTINDKLSDLQASAEVLKVEVADVKAQDNSVRIQQLENELQSQHQELIKLRDFVAGLPDAKGRSVPTLAAPKPILTPHADYLKRVQTEENRIQQQVQMKKGQ
jgi:hypothetical protein